MEMQRSQQDVVMTAQISSSNLEQQIQNLRQRLRPGQLEMADWQGGPLAVSAVPGAGKSYGMAAAAAIALARTPRQPAQQLILVTFTRAAATHLRQMVRAFLKELGLPQTGFMVQTLHSLALNIAARHPDQLRFDLANATLISPNQQHHLLRDCVEAWVESAPVFYQQLLEQGAWHGVEGDRLRRQVALRVDILPDLAQTAIHEAKSSGLTPADLMALAPTLPEELPILAIAAGLYQQYDRLLHRSGYIDYDDMILGALQILEQPVLLDFWQQQIVAIFEDEAQDSSPLQSRLLEKLAGHSGPENGPNLIRVGDANQAINSTFTPADPLFFRQFCQRHAPQRLATMDQSARSCPAVIAVANFLVTWANGCGLAGNEQPFDPQTILPVATLAAAADRPQNPDPLGAGVELYFPRDVYRTLEAIAQRVVALLRDDPTLRIALLVRENRQAEFVAAVLADPTPFGLNIQLTDADIPVYNVGDRGGQSQVPAEMLTLLQFLGRPHSRTYFTLALKTLAERGLIPELDWSQLPDEPEQLLYPSIPDDLELPAPQTLAIVRERCHLLLQARWELPLYQLISFLALELNYSPAELATADKLASRISRQMSDRLNLTDAITILQDIVSNERFDPVDIEADESQFTRPHQLTLITMHKAKGLDWDVVFLPFLHENVMPGSLRVPLPAQFLGDFTLADVARTQIRASLHHKTLPSAAAAWQQAQDQKIAEELRLLYVAMTRAKRLLWLSAAQRAPFSWGGFRWQTPQPLDRQTPCPVIPALRRTFPQIVRSLAQNLDQSELDQSETEAALKTHGQ